MASFPFNVSIHLFRQTVTFRDAKGNIAKMTFFVDTSAAVANSFVGAAQLWAQQLKTYLAALSNAAIQSMSGPETEYGVAQYGAHASGGSYESVVEKASLAFQDNAGLLHRFEVPAPKVAIFKSDKITIDPANTDVGHITTFLTTAFTDGQIGTTRQGVALANYMGGVYRGRKLRKRLNILVLEPDLTASLPAE